MIWVEKMIKKLVILKVIIKDPLIIRDQQIFIYHKKMN